MDFISKVLGGAYLHNGPFPLDSSFSVDSRTLKKGDIYVALQGNRVDGHDFIEQALDSGASGFIASEYRQKELLQKFGKQFENKHVLFVPDTLHALIELARSWRSQFNYPVVGITGSVGKTTTKQMVENILKLTDLNHLVSFGNQNSLIGISLNILKMRAHHQVAIFEVGISRSGVMKDLVALLRPTYALITKVGHSHTQGLGDIQSVAQQKRDIFSSLSQTDIGMINGDQQELSEIAYTHPVVRFGLKTTNQIQARKVVVEKNCISFTAKIYHEKYSVVLPSCNEGRVINALAAMTIGYMLKIPSEILIKGVEQPVNVPGRFQELKHSSGSVIINDAYNANPESVKNSLLSLNAYEPEKEKVVVLGDMLELGGESGFWHRQVGRFLHKVEQVYHVVLVGKEVKATLQALPIHIKATHFYTAQEAETFLKTMLLEKNRVFLCKGSNSIGLLKLVDILLES